MESPHAPRCQGTRVWPIRVGDHYECAACGHQASLTSSTMPGKTRKPLTMWFRAMIEISTRRTGISGKDLRPSASDEAGVPCSQELLKVPSGLAVAYHTPLEST